MFFFASLQFFLQILFLLLVFLIYPFLLHVAIKTVQQNRFQSTIVLGFGILADALVVLSGKESFFPRFTKRFPVF